MKLTVNREKDALYFRLDEAAAIATSEEVDPASFSISMPSDPS